MGCFGKVLGGALTMTEEIPVAPQKNADRVNGQKYLFNGEIRIWRVFSSQAKFHCEHDRQKNTCRDCNPVICEHENIQHHCSDCFYECEVCGISLCGLHHNKSYEESDYLEALDIVYRKEGIEAFSFERLKELRLYFPLYRFGWNAEKLCERYGMTTSEWKQRQKKMKIQYI